MEVGKTSPEHHSKESSKINLMLTEPVGNYENGNLMEVSKLDSINP